MATSDSTSAAPLSPLKEEINQVPTQTKLAEFNESRTELFSRIQSLKGDLQNWRSTLDTQVTRYKEELVELRKSLNVEVEQLRSEFQGLRTTLHQQQEDVTASLRNFGVQDLQREVESTQAQKVDNKDDNVEVDSYDNSTRATNIEDYAAERDDSHISSTINGDNDSNF